MKFKYRQCLERNSNEDYKFWVLLRFPFGVHMQDSVQRTSFMLSVNRSSSTTPEFSE
jgi:hypothetical protein